MENMDLELQRRLELQKKLKNIPGVTNVYYQPPEDVKLVYPCIIYKWDRERVIHADNRVYFGKRAYLVTMIDANPDSMLPIIFRKEFSMASLDRIYVSDGLNHWVYLLYW